MIKKRSVCRLYNGQDEALRLAGRWMQGDQNCRIEVERVFLIGRETLHGSDSLRHCDESSHGAPQGHSGTKTAILLYERLLAAQRPSGRPESMQIFAQMSSSSATQTCRSVHLCSRTRSCSSSRSSLSPYIVSKHMVPFVSFQNTPTPELLSLLFSSASDNSSISAQGDVMWRKSKSKPIWMEAGVYVGIVA